jgi:hypothetical protein
VTRCCRWQLLLPSQPRNTIRFRNSWPPCSQSHRNKHTHAHTPRTVSWTHEIARSRGWVITKTEMCSCVGAGSPAIQKADDWPADTLTDSLFPEPGNSNSNSCPCRAAHGQAAQQLGQHASRSLCSDNAIKPNTRPDDCCPPDANPQKGSPGHMLASTAGVVRGSRQQTDRQVSGRVKKAH